MKPKDLSHSHHKGLRQHIALSLKKHKGAIALHHKNKDGVTVAIEWMWPKGKSK